MATVFKDIPLTQQQIDENYVFKNIQLADSHAVSNVYVDSVRDNLVVANVDNTYDPAVATEVVLIGTDLTNTVSNSVVNIGHESSVINSDDVINIGGTADGAAPGAESVVDNCADVINIGESTRMFNSDQVIQLGGTSNIGTAVRSGDRTISIGFNSNGATEADAEDNITIGNFSASESGSRNIVIGQSPAWHDHTATTHEDNIVIAHRPLLAPLGALSRQGSVIIGGGGTSSALPRLQFLSPDMSRLQGATVLKYYGEDGALAAPTYQGSIRIKYQGLNLLIPVSTDPNDAAEAPVIP